MLRLLGEVGVDGAPPVAGSARRLLLTLLALARPAAVRTDRLVTALWQDAPPADPVAALHNHVSRLRRGLPPHVRVVTVAEGYRVDVADEHVDVCRLEAAVRQVPALPAAQRPAAVEEALRLWRGEPFAGVDHPDVLPERERLAGVRETLLGLRADALLASGRAAEAVTWLEAELATDPLDEGTAARLVRAHVALGRRAEALAVVRRTRAVIAAELGLDPSPTLQRLELDVLGDRLPVEPVEPVEPVAGPVAVAHRAVVPLLGREQDAVLASRLLRRHRLVTLVGPGGVGKTRLARHVALERPDVASAGRTVTTVELAAVQHEGDVVGALASAVGATTGSGTAFDRVVAHLRHGAHLLVVDNCEHVVEPAARAVHALLGATTDVVVLATSREPLDVDGERVVPLSPLGREAAVAVLRDRAAALGHPLPVDAATDAQVDRLCAAVDDLPLGIELAAARLRDSTLGDLLAHVDDLLGLLVGGTRTAATRHRSLRALVEWSVRDLPPALRETFRRGSVAAGPVDLATAAVVCGTGVEEAAARLAELARRSLVVQHRDDGRPLRYGYLETVRAYAADLLAASGEQRATRERHAAAVLDVVEAATAGTRSADPAAALGGLAELRAAHRHAHDGDDGPTALRLAAGLQHRALFGMDAEVFSWVQATAERYGDLDHPLAERVVALASTGAWQAGDLDRARALAARAEAVAARSAWPGAGAGAAEARGDVLLFEGDLEGAARCWEVAVVRTRAEGVSARLVTRLADRAMVLGYLGRQAEAAGCLAESRSLLDAEPSWVHAWVDYAEGEVVAAVDPDRALTVLERAMATAATTGAEFTLGVAGLTRAGLLVRHGTTADAAGLLREQLLRWRRRAAWVQQWITLRTAVELLVALDEPTVAAEVLGAVEAAGSAQASGPDAERLRGIAATLERRLPDVDARRRAGARLEPEAVVDLVLAHLPLAPDPPTRRTGRRAGETR